MSDRIVIHIKGMHCASCVARVERALEKVSGVEHAAVNLATEKAVVTSAAAGVIDRLLEAVRGAGYEAEVIDKAAGLGKIFKVQTRDSWLRFAQFLATLVLSLPVIVISMGGVDFPGVYWVLVGLSTGALLIGGSGFIYRAVLGAFRFQADMDTLVALGTLAAYVFSMVTTLAGNLVERHPGAYPGRHLYFETSVMILTFVLFGRWLESMAKGRATRSIKKLVSLLPGTAILIKGEAEPEEVPVEALDAGDVILVKPGGRIPADGEVLSGGGTVDESSMTGENRPVSKGPGDSVLAGTINGNGSLKIVIKRAGEATALSGIIRLVEQAQSSKPPIQRIADRVASVFVPAVLLAALATFAGWYISQPGQGFVAALVPAVAVLLVSCPCALGLATPTAITVGAGLAAEKGVLIRNAASLERLYVVDALVLDKTGTLTEGRHEVTDFVVLPGEDRLGVLSAAGTVEQESEHSLSRAVVRFARMEGAAMGGAAGFRALAGMGVSGVVREKEVVVGNTAILHHLGIEFSEVEGGAEALRAEGKTVVYVAIDGKVKGIIALADVVRHDAKHVVSELRRMGLKVLMVTGDTRETALAIGRHVGIPPQEILSEVRPEDKAMVVRQLKKEGLQVGMVGDGINDAPALAEADVGVAMGTGTDVAIETADVTLGRADIGVLLDAIRISHVTMRKIKQNLFWAFIYNVTLIPVAAMGKLNPMYAALAMSISSVTVVVNSLLIRRSSAGKPRV